MNMSDPDLVGCVSNTDLQLTDLERQLITNFRAMKTSSRRDMVAMSAEMARLLPAVPVKLTLVR
jgi:hypothetical protein